MVAVNRAVATAAAIIDLESPSSVDVVRPAVGLVTS
jgi:hypothetical protein